MIWICEIDIMFINIYRNPKTRNWFRYETFIHLLEFKGFRHEERETQSFYADCFYIISSQPNQRAAPIAHKVVWPHPGLNLNSLVWRQEFNYCFFSNPPNPQPMLPVHDVIHRPGLISYPGFYFDICEWRIFPMHAWTPALMFAPNQPMHWAKRFSS